MCTTPFCSSWWAELIFRIYIYIFNKVMSNNQVCILFTDCMALVAAFKSNGFDSSQTNFVIYCFATCQYSYYCIKTLSIKSCIFKIFSWDIDPIHNNSLSAPTRKETLWSRQSPCTKKHDLTCKIRLFLCLKRLVIYGKLMYFILYVYWPIIQSKILILCIRIYGKHVLSARGDGADYREGTHTCNVILFSIILKPHIVSM